jgi:hypothetical protein
LGTGWDTFSVHWDLPSGRGPRLGACDVLDNEFALKSTRLDPTL